jgi:ABC-type polysaccharide/polyol phosphate export permease
MSDHRGSWLNIYEYRFALLNLILKDFRIRYRNMSLGILWSVINPLVMLGVLLFVFTFLYPNRGIAHFPIFILLGLLFYNFFSLCVSCTTTCIIDNAPLVKKVIFPRIILPLSVVLSQVIHMVIQFGLLAVFVLAFRVPITVYFLWLPVIFAVELVFLIGVSLMCSMLNVYFRDVQYIVQSALQVLFWFTPTFYSLTSVHASLPKWLYGILILNPLAGLIDGSRKAVLYQSNPDAVAFSMAVAVSIVTFFLGIWLFQRYQRNFADRI